MTGPWAGERQRAGTGDGPIAAAFTAISEILGRPIEVLNLSLRSVTPGRDSVGQVFLQAQVDGKTLSGQRRVDRHRRGERPGADPRAEQGASRRPARGQLAQLHLPLGSVMAEQLTGAQILCRALSRRAWTCSSGYPGGAIMPFYHALPEYPGLRHVLVRHEQAAAHAADGYARASGRVGGVRRHLGSRRHEPGHRARHGAHGQLAAWSPSPARCRAP